MLITISSLEECVVCVCMKLNSGFKRWFKVLEFEKSVPKLKPNGLKILKNRSQTCISKTSKIFKLSELKQGFSSLKKE